MKSNILILTCAVLAFMAPRQLFCQRLPDPLQQKVGSFYLENQSLTDGVAKLSQETNLAYSIEYPLGAKIAQQAPALKALTSQINEGSVVEVLDQLCRLDNTFSWIRIGDSVNILPTRLKDDPNYFLNKKIGVLTFVAEPDAQKALFDAVAQLDGPKEQVAVLESGISVNFAVPWSATYKDITLRAALDEIAHQLGSSYGWQLTGASDFRFMTFHAKLAPHPVKKKD